MRFFETIKIKEGKAAYLSYHNRRLNKTIQDHFGFDPQIDLEPLLDPPTSGLYRCKVIYSDSIESISYTPYIQKKIAFIKPIHADIDYGYKYLDRSAIELLATQKGDADEIVIIKNGLLTDTSIANIALYQNGRWLTPAHPLLPGTTRARYIKKGLLHLANLTIEDLFKSEKMALLNAMIDFFEVKLSIIE